MKKNIEIINAKTPLLEWAVGTLKKSPERPEGADELIGGMTALLDNEESTLMIEQSNSSDGFSDGRKICCGELAIYVNYRRVLRGSTEISLTPKEFDILCFLAKNRGEVFTKEQIYKAVWDDEYLLDDSNIMAFIRKLRKKIEPNPDAPRYILTVWGVGYKFNEEI